MHLENLGEYNLLRLLGHGAFGQVYLAEHRFIKRTFALKVLPKELVSDASFMRRLEEHVHAVAALDHPNIVKIHNIASFDDQVFIVTDPIVDSLGETMNLDRYLTLKGRSLSEEDYLGILRQVASALDYAHEQNMGGLPIVHGALKLTNLLVTPTEEGIRVVLSDFSLSRFIGEGVSLLRLCEQISQALMPSSAFLPEKAVQQSRNFIRSFGFLAPEQKNIDVQNADPKIDSYAFGVLCYFLIARKLPEGCFDLPSRIFPEANGNWDYLISRCLQMAPSMRPLILSQAIIECLKAPKVETKEMLGLSELEKKLDNVMQLSFEFHPDKSVAAVGPVGEAASSLKPVLRPKEIQRPEYENDPMEIVHRDTQVSQYVPKVVEIKEIDPMLTEMAVVNSGTYHRGSNEGSRDESPRHAITLSSYAIDVHPVTNEQFMRFIQAMGGEKDSNNNDIIRLKDSRIKRTTGKLIIESGYAKHPVVGVTWYGAVAYAKWIGKRLPTEAEWEVAASSGNETHLYPTGDDIERMQANFFSSDTSPVMSYPPNDLGLYDMAGNVYEWCRDWYAYNYYESSLLEPENPQGPLQGVYRVLRGGCWKSLKEDMRCSHRHRNNPGAVNGTYGFRCAADVQ